MMSDYFAALAARTLQPELGVQPRHRARWEDAVPPAADLVEAIPRKTIAWRGDEVTEWIEEARPLPSQRRFRREAGRPLDTADPPQERRDRMVQKTTETDDDARIAATRHPKAGTAQPEAGVGAERVEARSGPVPPPKGAPLEDGRAPAMRARGTWPDVDVPARIAGREQKRSESEPAIRIHIGRVDVRAVAAAAPSLPVSRERKRALMSLDEYVQKRDRGGS